MSVAAGRPVVVLLAGPQASGKSTVTAALSEGLRRDGESVALVELDGIAAMALPTLPSWATAHRIFESVVAQWARADLTCVIAEGSGSAAEVATLRAAVPDGAPVVTVAVSASFPVAYARARQDRSRDVSRQHDFLSAVYRRWPAESARMDADLVVDTETLSLPECVERLRAAVVDARGR